MHNLVDQAVKAALNQDWEKAIDLNHHILGDSPQDIQTLNRLGFAYMQSGQIKSATQTYTKVLQIDKYNPIAKRSLDKLTARRSGNQTGSSSPKVFCSFLEEPGRTKTTFLVRTGDPELILSLNPGTPVSLVCKKRRVFVETSGREYVGSLPDDLSFKLFRFILAGYQYDAFVKSSESKSVCVFIKETVRPIHSKNISSFPVNAGRGLKSIPRPQPLEEIPIDITPTGEGASD